MDTNINRSFYNKFWSKSHVLPPELWGYWKYIASLGAKKRLEIGAGVRPRIPVKGSNFVDISSVSLQKLKEIGGEVLESDLQTKLPYKSAFFDLVCCFETLEHVPDDEFLIKEISRVLKPGGHALISFPINMSRWTEYDKTVGHYRRYNPSEIPDLFGNKSLKLTSYTFLQVPWPNKYSGKILSVLYPIFFPVFSVFADFADSLPSSELRRPLRYEPFTSFGKERITYKDTTLSIICVKTEKSA